MAVVAITVRRGPDYWSAVDTETTAYGVGDTPAEALRDYQESLAEHLQWFAENEHHLGPGLAADYAELKRRKGPGTPRARTLAPP